MPALQRLGAAGRADWSARVGLSQSAHAALPPGGHHPHHRSTHSRQGKGLVSFSLVVSVSCLSVRVCLRVCVYLSLICVCLCVFSLSLSLSNNALLSLSSLSADTCLCVVCLSQSLNDDCLHFRLSISRAELPCGNKQKISFAFYWKIHCRIALTKQCPITGAGGARGAAASVASCDAGGLVQSDRAVLPGAQLPPVLRHDAHPRRHPTRLARASG